MLVIKEFSICSLHECNSPFCNERALLTINKEFKQLEISILLHLLQRKMYFMTQSGFIVKSTLINLPYSGCLTFLLVKYLRKINMCLGIKDSLIIIG